MSPVPRNCPPCQEAHRKALLLKTSHTTKDENKEAPQKPQPTLPQNAPFRQG